MLSRCHFALTCKSPVSPASFITLASPELSCSIIAMRSSGQILYCCPIVSQYFWYSLAIHVSSASTRIDSGSYSVSGAINTISSMDAPVSAQHSYLASSSPCSHSVDADGIRMADTVTNKNIRFFNMSTTFYNIIILDA